MEASWLQTGDPVDWQDFETASATGKEILERLAGDRSLLRQLTFTARERDDDRGTGAWTGDGGEVELFADESKKLYIYLHVGLGDHDGQPSPLPAGYVAKVLTSVYRHVWYTADDSVAYVTDEQPPGLYAMRAGLMHTLSWGNLSTALLLREARAVTTEPGGLTDVQYASLLNRADSAGIL